MDKLIIVKSKKKQGSTAWKPLMVPPETYERINSLAEEVNMVKGDLVTRMIDYALDHLAIQEEQA